MFTIINCRIFKNTLLKKKKKKLTQQHNTCTMLSFSSLVVNKYLRSAWILHSSADYCSGSLLGSDVAGGNEHGAFVDHSGRGCLLSHRFNVIADMLFLVLPSKARECTRAC